MPTANPRIQLTLRPERHDLLKRLAALQGVSMAAVVSDILDPAYPVLERVCVVLEAAERAKESSRDGMREAMAKAEAELMPHLVQAVDQFDMFMGEVAKPAGVNLDAFPESAGFIREAMGKAKKSASGERDAQLTRSAGAPLDPPVVTRGSGTGGSQPKKTPKSPSKPRQTRSHDK